MSPSTEEFPLWRVDPACVGGATVGDPEVADDDERLDAIWGAAHEPSAVGEWQPLHVTATGSVSSVLYVEEAEVLVFGETVRSAVDGVGGAASNHVWLPVTVEADGSDLAYWVLHCGVPDVARDDRSVDPDLARDAAVVHYEVGDNFPAFSDGARRAIEGACADVALFRANP